jgi:hypothetical protein
MFSASAAPALLPWQKPGNLRPIREPAMGGVVAPDSLDTNVQTFSGRLQIKIDGQPHYCSGVFVHERVIVTAAHCVQQNGANTKYEVVNFVREGGEVFSLQNNCIKVPVEWATQTDEYLRINYDYAFLKLTSAVSGLKVQLVTTDPYGHAIKAYGYPASQPGLTAISANAAQDVLHPQLVGLSTPSIGFTEGTSGGAWVRDIGSGAQPFKVVSVNSSYAFPVYDKTQIWIYGPNFNRPKEGVEAQSAQEVLQDAVGCS